MKMIDRELLSDMEFVECPRSGWNHEVWYHDSDFWVHFGDPIKGNKHEISASASRKEFFRRFIAHVCDND